MSTSAKRAEENPGWRSAAESLGSRDRSFSVTAIPRSPITADRIAVDRSTPADAIPALSEDYGAHALLAQQCRSRIDGLAPRQREVLAELVAGRSNKQVAHMLGLSPRTVEVYRASMMDRLKVRTLAQALYIAFMAGLAPLDTLFAREPIERAETGAADSAPASVHL